MSCVDVFKLGFSAIVNTGRNSRNSGGRGSHPSKRCMRKSPVFCIYGYCSVCFREQHSNHELMRNTNQSKHKLHLTGVMNVVSNVGDLNNLVPSERFTELPYFLLQEAEVCYHTLQTDHL